MRIAAVLLAAVIVYLILIRSWMLNMGASAQERTAPMPGDGWVHDPNMKYTQAVTINAPRDIVWAYLIQVGYRRSGWYNWDFVNRLADRNYFFEGRKSAQRIIPELQNLQEGDQIFLTPQLGMLVEKLQTSNYMILTGRNADSYLVVWTFCLTAPEASITRLIVRWTSNQNEGLLLKLLNLILIEPGGAGIQQSQMLRGIKQRAEADFKKKR